jgi:hypothetical protein
MCGERRNQEEVERVDIGKTIKTYTIEPVEDPVPRREPKPEPEREPPPLPEREPERVGA